MRAPLPGETVNPEQMMTLLRISLKKRGLRLPQPVKWTMYFGERRVFTISFDGEQWAGEAMDAPAAEVRVETTPETWATFLQSPQEERKRLVEAMRIRAEQSRANELLVLNGMELQP